MIPYIPSISTIKEYKRLVKTQEPVNVTQTNKKMDNYVYHRQKDPHSLSYILLGAIDAVLLYGLNTGKSFSNNFLKNSLLSIGLVGMLDFFVGWYFHNEAKSDIKLLNDNNIAKKDLYKKAGINAVI